ncbi:MAG: SUF system Fe-S cluster assembly regulator [Pseudomonadota bacterium]
MLRISKLTDYGTVILADLADRGDALASATDVADHTGLGPATVRKLLKTLARAGLVEAKRGAKGGYRLARAPATITAAQVIDALEGPVSITECSVADKTCEIEANCTIGGAWQRINVAIRTVLDDITLADLQTSKIRAPRFEFAGMPITIERTTERKQR